VGETDACAPGGDGSRKRIAAVQSSYIPWKGYFDLIRRVDEFVLLDDVQFTRRDWRNRNRIKTPQGLAWLTIPVETKGRFRQTIAETRVSDPSWPERHWTTLRHAYGRAPYFEEYAPKIEALYSEADDPRLSAVNHRFLRGICAVLGIDTPITWSMDYATTGTSTERLVSLCVDAGADTYLSGPSARAYLDESLFREEGVSVAWMEYEGYDEYDQLYPPFEHGVTILDLLFHTGPEAIDHMLPLPPGVRA
jgi:hypothetical protein